MGSASVLMATKEEKEAKVEMKETVAATSEKVEAKAEEKVESKKEESSEKGEGKDMKENPKHLGWNSHEAVVRHTNIYISYLLYNIILCIIESFK